MFEWFDALHHRWQIVSDIALELWERFYALPQSWKPVVILLLLMALALMQLVASFWAVEDPEVGRAPTGLQPRPPLLSSPKRWFEWYVATLYVRRCRNNSIGWFAPWLMLWLSSVGLVGCTVLSIFEALGVILINKQSYLYGFGALLLFGAAIGMAHNAGRRAGRGASPVKLRTFAWVFYRPLAMAVALVAFTLYRPSPTVVWKMIAATGVFS